VRILILFYAVADPYQTFHLVRIRILLFCADPVPAQVVLIDFSINFNPHYLDVDPDLTYHFDADPACHPDADADPDQGCQNDIY
jgi:hypothetical protein